ncbi:uncharacterized protein J7T54_008018 [Emericellopsis cladophorae]|uniref:Uncharacterized protein n=1 Tax=Emericellopsis cladophorae TaxID=2686198 RepID=A0A9Q0BHY0_9HYPO|nr:uncharacterized protein J7T54_008018 [Emericellopsis cladophorae]KAI6784924.1 hypothetical protein J7T54_008018 [Emericellopsis cladophorae]
MTDQFQLVVAITLAICTSAVTENPIYEEALVEATRETLESANEHTNVVKLSGAKMALDDGLHMFLNFRQDLTTDDPAITRAFDEWQIVNHKEVFSKPPGGDPGFQVIVTRDTLKALGRGFARDVLMKQYQYTDTCTSNPKGWDAIRSLEYLKLGALSAPTGEALDEALQQITAVITSEAAIDLCVSIRQSKFMTKMLGDFIKAIMDEPSHTNPRESEEMDVRPGTAAVADIEDEADGAFSESERVD